MVFDGVKRLIFSGGGNNKHKGGRVLQQAHEQRLRDVFARPLDVARDWVAPLYPKTSEQEEFLNSALSDHFVFSHLSDAERHKLIQAMELVSFHEGAKLMKQGDKGDYIYVIQKGTVHFVVDGKDEGDGTKGAIVGELALLYDCPRAATVVAATDLEVWRISQFTFRHIKAAHTISSDDEARETIASLSYFRDLPEGYINMLADSLFQKKYKKGDILFDKGEEIQALVMIKQGFVRGTNLKAGGSTSLADIRLGPGQSFGERVIITGEKVTGTVYAETDVMAFFLTKERFLKTVGHLNLNDLMRQSADSKMLVSIYG